MMYWALRQSFAAAPFAPRDPFLFHPKIYRAIQGLAQSAAPEARSRILADTIDKTLSGSFSNLSQPADSRIIRYFNIHPTNAIVQGNKGTSRFFYRATAFLCQTSLRQKLCQLRSHSSQFIRAIERATRRRSKDAGPLVAIPIDLSEAKTRVPSAPPRRAALGCTGRSFSVTPVVASMHWLAMLIWLDWGNPISQRAQGHGVHPCFVNL